jgi:glycerate 2-kinase
MKILLAPDKFKGSLTAREVCLALSAGLKQHFPEVIIEAIPLADGGEGTCSVLTEFAKGRMIKCPSSDPLGRPIVATYGISADGEKAFIEMASASGLGLLKNDERNAANTSTAGTGQLLKHALDTGVKSMLLGIGGSATNDAGLGLLHMLGLKIFDEQKNELVPIGRNLSKIQSVDAGKLDPRVKHTRFTLLCDVQNPLYGMNGAAHVYARQKGADETTIHELDAGLMNFAEIVSREFGLDANFPGAGAGGGVAAGAKVFLNADIKSGIDFIIEFTALEERIKKSDLVITGEGKIDRQTLSGKVVNGISKICRKNNVPLIVVTGKNDLHANEATALGAARIISLTSDGTSDADAMADAFQLLQSRISDAVRPFIH